MHAFVSDGQYVTRREDGFHVEQRCCCGAVLEGVGQSQTMAYEALRTAMAMHRSGGGRRFALRSVGQYIESVYGGWWSLDRCE